LVAEGEFDPRLGKGSFAATIKRGTDSTHAPLCPSCHWTDIAITSGERA